MATAHFDTTIAALASGPENLTPEEAIEIIDGWQHYLAEHQTEGTQVVSSELAQLKQHLSEAAPDTDAIEALLKKLGASTLHVANNGNTSNAADIMEIGEALSGE